MLGTKQYELIGKISWLSEEERLEVIYDLIYTLNKRLNDTINSTDAVIIAPSLINDTLTLVKDFETILRQLYQLENKISIKEDIDNSTSLILR